VVEASGGWARWLVRGGAAMTPGHVILARDAECMDRSRVHELVHVRQYERWGPLLLPVYWLGSAWLRWRAMIRIWTTRSSRRPADEGFDRSPTTCWADGRRYGRERWR
jgi:hypothetical protein